MHQDATWYGGRPQPGDFVLDGDPAPLPKNGDIAPAHQFSVHFYCGQTAGCIKVPLGIEVGLSLRDIVLDGNPAPPPIKGTALQFSANVRCGQTAGWTKMPIRTEIGVGAGDFVFDRDPAMPRKEAHPPHLTFDPCILWPNGWMDKDATWYGSRPRPRPHCVRRGPSSHRKGHSSPLFSAHVYCGHGRPSQLLLSSCFLIRPLVINVEKQIKSFINVFFSLKNIFKCS